MRAREVFGAARAAAARIEELRFLCEMDGPPSGGDGGPGPKNAVGDPTGSAAQWRIEDLVDLEREMDACQDAVAEAMVLIDGVLVAWGRKSAEVLELYYIDGMSWADVADEVDRSKTWVRSHAQVLCEWIDSMPPKNVRAGKGSAEG